MKTKSNTVLITGGATGIGFAIAERLLGLGNEVIICGRREGKLSDAKAKLPRLNTIKCDVSKEGERIAMLDYVRSNFPDINILINNAGIQRRIDLKKGAGEILKDEDEFEINFKAQVYLTAMFTPLFLKKEDAAIINVSSGLGFVPLAVFPIYCATKAAIHSFTLSLRHQLRDTPVKVFEVVPPTVHDTELKGEPIEKAEWSVSASEVADAVMKGLEKDEYEIAVGPTRNWIKASREDLDKAFGSINR